MAFWIGIQGTGLLVVQKWKIIAGICKCKNGKSIAGIQKKFLQECWGSALGGAVAQHGSRTDCYVMSAPQRANMYPSEAYFPEKITCALAGLGIYNASCQLNLHG